MWTNRYGFTIGNPSRFGQGSYPDERLYQAQETVDWVKGKLLVKSGFEVSHNFDATSLLRNQTGTYNYSSVENFASDALAFAAFGTSGELNPFNQHNCDQTGKVWRDSAGGLRGLGALPCYSYYSQMIGPSNWQLSTNDWAGFITTQWQPNKIFVLSAGLRWEREQLPPPMAALWPPPVAPNSPSGTLPAQKLPDLGNDWGPRLSLAVGNRETHWPVLRLGYGMYYGRTENATVETALTQTGSANGDQNFFIRPTDGYNSATGTSGAPPFPDCADRRAGQPGRAGGGGVCAPIPQSRGAPGGGCRRRKLARPRGGDRQRDGEPGPAAAHLHRYQLRSGGESADHHLCGCGRHGSGSHQDPNRSRFPSMRPGLQRIAPADRC